MNAQLYLNGDIRNICLLCREVKDRHLASNIPKLIADGQHQFKISDPQIIALKIDSAKSMISEVDCFVRNLSKEHEGAEEEKISEALEKVQNTRFDDDPTKEIDELEDEDHEVLEEDINDELCISLDTAIRIHCVAQELQLAIEVFLWKIKENSRLITLAQKLSSKLRNSIVRSMIADAKLNQAIIDQKSRWSSTYLMIVRLLELKEFCEHKSPLLRGLNISAEKWKSLKEICDVLKPFAELTTHLKSEKLDVTQFVGFWKLAMFKVEQQGSDKAIELKKCVEAREKSIFANRLIQAAIYLDKRFNFTLKPEESENAKTFIEQIMKKRKIVAGEIDDEKHVNSEMNQFDAFLNDLAKGNSSSSSSMSAEAHKCMAVLEKEFNVYDSLRRLPADTQIMDWWKNQEHFPVLKEIALDIISAPVTGVSDERLFSHLNFIMNTHRSTEQAELLEDILFLRMNNNLMLCGDRFTRSDELQRHRSMYLEVV